MKPGPKPRGDHTLTPAERTAAFRARRKAAGLPPQDWRSKGWQDSFVATLRILTFIEEHEVPSFSGPRWRAFRADPFGFLLNAGEADAQAIWEAVMNRPEWLPQRINSTQRRPDGECSRCA
jgi:hypothetical protein